ncbi:MAG: hypothetical protein KBT34_12545, partial [Prevotella sp.]|nr:hypothetical protein [Candidatus Prevotella equi]
MMKKFYLFLLTMMVSAVSAFAAAKPTPNFSAIESGKEYYLYNVEYGGFLVGANEWGTRASVSQDKGMKNVIEAVTDGVYRLGAFSIDGDESVWIDGSRDGNKTFTFTAGAGNTYTIGTTKYEGTILTWTGDEANTRVNFTASTENGTWGAVTQADYDAYFAAVKEWKKSEIGILEVTNEITSDVDDLDGKTVVISIDGKVLACIGEAHDMASKVLSELEGSNTEYFYSKLAKVTVDGAEYFTIQMLNSAGANFTKWGNQGYANFQPVGTGNIMFALGLDKDGARIWGQDAANHGIWTITKEADGYYIQNVGRQTYWNPNKADALTADPVLVKLYEKAELVKTPAGWDGETVTTSIDGTVLANADAIEGLSLTFEGAKSIEADEEGGYLMLVADEDGSEILKVWGACFGGDAVVDGSTVTLNKWVNLSDVYPGGASPYADAVKKARKVRKAVAEDSWYIQDFGAFIIDGEAVTLDDIAVAHEAVPVPFMATSVSNNGVEGSLMAAVEASEAGVSKTFVLKANGKTLAKGTAAATLAIFEDAEADFGAATVAITEEGAEISFDAAGKDMFTAPGTYVLSIPEGVVVDEEGNPNAALTLKWVVIQKDPEPALADGNYYIQNVASGLFMAGNNSWGTQASAVKTGDEFYVTLKDGVYTLIGTALESANKTLGYNLYVDTNTSQNGNTWTIAPVEGEDGVFTIYGKGKKDKMEDAFDGYIAQSATAGDVTGFILEGVSEVTDAAKWRFVTKAELVNGIKAGDDVSFLLDNPGFTRNHATASWIVDEGCTHKNLKGGANNNMCAESYHSIFNIHQTITGAPNGTYSLTAQGFYRQDGEDAENLPVFYANDNEVVFPVKTGAENSMADASGSFTAGLYTIDPITFEVTDGTITVGVKNEANANLWCIWDNFQLTYLGAAAAAPEVAIVEGEGTYTVTSTSETAALYYLCKPMSWLDDGETPESCLQNEIEGMGSMISSEEEWELYGHMGMQPAPKTFTVADYQEMYAGEDMFLIAANVGWDGEKLAVISNIEKVNFTVPAPVAEIEGEPFDISWAGMPTPDDAVRTFNFDGQWQAIEPNIRNFDPADDKQIVVKFAEPLSVGYNVPFKTASGAQEWNACGGDQT